MLGVDAHHRPLHAHITHIRSPLAEAFRLFARASKQLDQQRPANVERFVHVRIHQRVGFHAVLGNLAQAAA